MLDTIHVASSGLTTHQKGLRVISGNVTNMNTPGYKGSNNQFTDVFLKEASTQDRLNTGGQGAGTASLPPTINFRAGEISQTGRDLDLALQGPGFFAVQNDDGQTLFTKSGRFAVNEQGQMVTQDQGYSVLSGAGGSGALARLDLSSLRIDPYKATREVRFSGNLSSTAGSASTTGPEHTVDNLVVYDAMGAARTLKAEFSVKRVTAPGSTEATLQAGVWVVRVLEGTTEVGTGELRFSSGVPDPLADRFNINLRAADGSTSPVALVLGIQATGFSSGTTSSLVKETIDGNAAGTVTKYAVNDKGQVVVTYTNGRTANGPTLAVAEFLTPEVLQRASGAYFTAPVGQEPRYVAAGDTTKLIANSLELSNTDLTDQFSTMILVQRGFQASSQVMSTASEMIQSLFDLKSRR